MNNFYTSKSTVIMIPNSAFVRIHRYVVVFESYGDIIEIQERVACSSNSLAPPNISE